MKIKMLTCMTSADFVLNVGDETDRFEQAEAQRLIEAGYAVPVAAEKIERAVKAPAPETRAATDKAKREPK